MKALFSRKWIPRWRESNAIVSESGILQEHVRDNNCTPIIIWFINFESRYPDQSLKTNDKAGQKLNLREQPTN